jgi:cob(I)alamin adenosyltransferase
VYKRQGDDGTTGLVGGNRVKKFDLRLEAYGTIDELNSTIGVLRSAKLFPDIDATLQSIQNKLFNIGSILASDEKGKEFTKDLAITEEFIVELERAIDKYQENLPELNHFILPGGDFASAQCHVVRTVCRRAERRILEFSEQSEVQNKIIKYVNRLSDYFFALSRKIAFDNGVDQPAWEKG